MNETSWYRCSHIRKIRGQSVPCGFVGRGEDWNWYRTSRATASSPEEWDCSCPRCHTNVDDCAEEICDVCMRPVEVCKKDKGNCIVRDLDGEPMHTGDEPLDAVLNDMADDPGLVSESVNLMLEKEIVNGR